jgi:DNA-binding Lrp family transcriptional regulator
MAVPIDKLDEVAGLVSAFPEVNHNYQREHRFNLWFVVAGKDREHVTSVLEELRGKTGLDVLDLPLEQAFHIDLGFPLRWS